MAGEEMFGLVCGFLPIAVIALFFFLATSVRIIYQYERGVVFTFGRYAGMFKPGINFLIPVVQTMKKVDVRIKTVDIPKQEVMTRDNVPVLIDAVVYFRVERPDAAILEIEDYVYAVSKYAQTALRDVVGNSELDFVLTERDKIADSIKENVDRETDDWGIDVSAIKLQDIQLPADMKRAMARQAEAEREKRGIVIMSAGELEASGNLSEAAKKLGTTPGALHLRTLQTLHDMSTDPSNKIILVTPIEVLRAMESFVDKKKHKGTE